VVIISYSMVPVLADRIALLKPGVVICDECHYLKNPRAKRTKALSGIVKRAARAIVLSGTPALSRPAELFTTLNMLRQRDWSSEAEFHSRYCSAAAKGGGGQKRGAALERLGANNTAELHLLLSSTLMIRRLKCDILKALPRKRRSIVGVDVPKSKEAEECRNLLAKIVRKDEEKRQKRARVKTFGTSATGVEAGAGAGAGTETGAGDKGEGEEEGEEDRVNMMTRLYQLTGRAKIEAVLPHIHAFLANPLNGKLLVFAHHKAVLDRLQQYLGGRTSGSSSSSSYHESVGLIRIDGNVNARRRLELVNSFQQDPKIRVALLSITAAGVALTLTASSTVFFAELFWTPGSLLQCEDRVHRIGQVNEVKISYFLSDGTADNLLWPLLKDKMRVLGEVVEGRAGLDLKARMEGRGRGGGKGRSEKRRGAGVDGEESSSDAENEDEDENEDEGGDSAPGAAKGRRNASLSLNNAGDDFSLSREYTDSWRMREVKRLAAAAAREARVKEKGQGGGSDEDEESESDADPADADEGEDDDDDEERVQPDVLARLFLAAEKKALQASADALRQKQQASSLLRLAGVTPPASSSSSSSSGAGGGACAADAIEID
jgi:hypothetical protein